MHRAVIILILTLLTCAYSLTWPHPFSRSKDTSEASAKALERGVATPFPRKELGTEQAPSIEQLTPVEVPLPPDDNTGKGVDKQIIESAMAGMGDTSGEQAPAFPPSTSNTTREAEDADGSLDTLRKEIADASKPIGPQARLEGKKEVETQHSSLAHGIEQAIAGLTTVYNALRESPHKIRASEDVHNQGSVSGIDKNMTGEGINNGMNETQTNETKSGVETMSQRRGTGTGGNSILGIAAILGVVGAIALVIMGVRQGEREVEAPLYPPRGPSFV